jgi:hypothetical protein
MTPDPLDDLLDAAAPPTRTAREADLAAMIAEARAHGAAPRHPRRTRRLAITSGVLAAILVGGAGVAAATDGFTWGPGVEDPLGAVQFTMSNGMACELRFSEFTEGADPAFVAEVNRRLEVWFRTTDIVGEAEALLPRMREQDRVTRITDRMWPDSNTTELSAEDAAAEEQHRTWVTEWAAWTLAVEELELEALRDTGITLPDPRMDGAGRNGQIQCTDEAGEPYLPGVAP